MLWRELAPVCDAPLTALEYVYPHHLLVADRVCLSHSLAQLHSLLPWPSKSGDAQEALPDNRVQHNQLQADTFNRKTGVFSEPQPQEVEEVCCFTSAVHLRPPARTFNSPVTQPAVGFAPYRPSCTRPAFHAS